MTGSLYARWFALRSAIACRFADGDCGGSVAGGVSPGIHGRGVRKDKGEDQAPTAVSAYTLEGRALFRPRYPELPFASLRLVGLRPEIEKRRRRRVALQAGLISLAGTNTLKA